MKEQKAKVVMANDFGREMKTAIAGMYASRDRVRILMAEQDKVLQELSDQEPSIKNAMDILDDAIGRLSAKMEAPKESGDGEKKEEDPQDC